MLALLLLACTASSGDSGPDGGASPDGGAASGGGEIPDRVHLADGFIRDATGRALVLRGVNDSNAAKDPATDFLGWTTAEDVARLPGWGFDSVRLLTFWEAIEPTEGTHDQAYLDALEARVRHATDAGLYVVLDMHQDLWGRGFGGDGAPEWTCDAARYDSFEPTDPWGLGYLSDEIWSCFDEFWASPTLQARYVEAWVAAAERVADDPLVIGFDLMNEPWPARGDAADFMAGPLQALHAQVALRLAEVAPGKLIFVEPITMIQYGQLDPGFAALDGAELVYAPHYYDPAVHEGLPYDGDSTPLDLAFGAYDDHAAAMSSTWWLGEYGGGFGESGIAAYLADVDARLADRGVGSAIWTYDQGGGFAILDGAGGLRADIAQALLHPRVMVYGGDPGGETWDEATGTLTFSLRHRDGVPTDSEVWIGQTEVGDLQIEGATVSPAAQPGRLVVHSGDQGGPISISGF